jgi:hypothetical protein
MITTIAVVAAIVISALFFCWVVLSLIKKTEDVRPIMTTCPICYANNMAVGRFPILVKCTCCQCVYPVTRRI